MQSKQKSRHAATWRLRNTDTPDGASDLQASVYHTPSTPIDFDAILALQPYIQRVARRVLARAGYYQDDDVRELAAAVTHQIAERAAREPQYLSNSAAYVVSFAVWRARNQQRHQACNQQSLDELLQAEAPAPAAILRHLVVNDPTDSPSSEYIEAIAVHLTPKARTTLTAIRDFLDEILTSNGRLSEAALAKRMGKDRSTVAHRVDGLRTELARLI